MHLHTTCFCARTPNFGHYSLIALAKEEGRLGVRDLIMIPSAIPNKKTAGIWEKTSILTFWMQARCTKRRVLEDTNVRPTIDSAQLKEHLADRIHAQKFIECRVGNSVQWKIGIGRNYLGTIIENLRTRAIRILLLKDFGHTCLSSSQSSSGSGE